MAQQKGLINISGTIGDVNFYIINNKGYARKAGGGFNSKAIKTKPNMQRVRENASEFGHCSQAKKHYRIAFTPFLEGYRERKLHARMMGLFTTIKTLDAVSVRGGRRVIHGLETTKGKRLLKQFTFTPKHPFLSALHSKCHYDATTQTMHINAFWAYHHAAPKSATHIGIKMGVLDFDFETLKSDLRLSPTHYVPLNSTDTFTLQPNRIAPILHQGVVILGVRYYEIIENPDGAAELYPMGGVGISSDF